MSDKQQFLPTLLDRLLDEEPKKQIEAFDKTFYDARTYRRLVQRDLVTLLNCTNMQRELCPVKHSDVAKTVVNYGISPLIGSPGGMHNWRIVENNLRDAILRFEPRIIPDSLAVHVLHSQDNPLRNGKMMFEIRGYLYWQPHPLDLCINGQYDSETEGVELSEK